MIMLQLKSCSTTLVLTYYFLPFLVSLYHHRCINMRCLLAPHGPPPHRCFSDPMTALAFALYLSRHTHRCASFRNRNQQPFLRTNHTALSDSPTLCMHCRW